MSGLTFSGKGSYHCGISGIVGTGSGRPPADEDGQGSTVGGLLNTDRMRISNLGKAEPATVAGPLEILVKRLFEEDTRIAVTMVERMSDAEAAAPS